MKMGFIFNEVFWGVFLILLGLGVILKVLFNLNIPMFRLAVSFFLIYLGIRILMGGTVVEKGKNIILFENSTITVENFANPYNIIFSHGVLDLRGVKLGEKTEKVQINTVFGASILKVNPELPLKIVVNSAFAGAKMPNGNVITMGKYIYLSKKFTENDKYLEMEVNVVFGGLEIID